jgi:hypothetical protein
MNVAAAKVPVYERSGSDTCEPRNCEMGHRPHDHCECGLPMALGASRCRLCELEGLSPIWSHPSRRQRRVVGPDRRAYWSLLAAVLTPPPFERPASKAS